MTTAQLDGLADAVDGRYRALVLCAGLGGIRDGELFALRRPEPDDYVFTSPEGVPLERNNFRTRV